MKVKNDIHQYERVDDPRRFVPCMYVQAGGTNISWKVEAEHQKFINRIPRLQALSFQESTPHSQQHKKCWLQYLYTP